MIVDRAVEPGNFIAAPKASTSSSAATRSSGGSCTPSAAKIPGWVAHTGLLDYAIGARTATRSQAAAEAAPREASVPCGPILTATDVAGDPHFAARGMHGHHRVPKLTERPGRTRGRDRRLPVRAGRVGQGSDGRPVTGLPHLVVSG
ncbi:CoA transferase [Amycolatopsis sp. NPDC004378]